MRPKNHQKGQRRQLIFQIQQTRAEEDDRETSSGLSGRRFRSCRAAGGAEEPFEHQRSLRLNKDAERCLPAGWRGCGRRSGSGPDGSKIPCWSNRWPSASWELCPQISVMVLNSTGSCHKGGRGRFVTYWCKQHNLLQDATLTVHQFPSETTQL